MEHLYDTAIYKNSPGILIYSIEYYLYGHSKYKIALLLFLKFIKDEEDYFGLRANEYLNRIPNKNEKIKIDKTNIIFKT